MTGKGKGKAKIARTESKLADTPDDGDGSGAFHSGFQGQLDRQWREVLGVRDYVVDTVLASDAKAHEARATSESVQDAVRRMGLRVLQLESEVRELKKSLSGYMRKRARDCEEEEEKFVG